MCRRSELPGQNRSFRVKLRPQLDLRPVLVSRPASLPLNRMFGLAPFARAAIIPPALRRGSTIRIIAPSGPFDRTLFWRAVGWLAERYRPKFDEAIFERDGFLAGSDQRRRTELQQAIDDTDAHAIVMARGGWGAARLAPAIDFRGLLTHPKWLVGFSDPTALHAHAWQLGVASMHASNLMGLGRGDEMARQSWAEALEFPATPRILTGQGWHPGRATGILVGGNLTVLVHSLALGGLSLPDNCILALEDVSESSYRVDRLLSALLNSGAADKVSAFALGQFIDCDPGRHEVEVSHVLREQLGRLGVPVIADLPFGHGTINVSLPFGMPAMLDGRAGLLHLAIG